MPISEESLRAIAEIFVGDRGQLYDYRKGPEIVDFFNQQFGYRESYQWGNAPTRWVYARDKIAELFTSGRANEFFSSILSYQHMMRLWGCGELEARRKVEAARAEFNRLLRPDGFALSGSDGNFNLVEIDDDLVLIGEGGFAKAFLQKSTGLVVKKLNEESILDERARHRFKREFAIMKELSGVRGVLAVYDFDEDSCSYTMEAGERTLESFMSEPLPENVKTAILEQVLQAMASMHDKGYIHRDISPTNIFVLHGEIKIADFGLGKNLNTLASHITSSTRNYGQYFYCSPEQLLYLKDGDKRSDVFSLGRLINFVMTGDPVDGTHKLRHVSEKATSQDPSNRYQDASELLEAFRRRLAISADEQRIAAIVEKMQRRIIDDEVSGWILEMQPRQLCEKIISLPGFANAIARFACDSGPHATFVVDSIGEGMVEACGSSFEANDPFASISSQAATSDTAPFDVRERACVILAYVAHCVNRFNAQRIVDDLIDKGIDPILEDVLRSCPSKPSLG